MDAIHRLGSTAYPPAGALEQSAVSPDSLSKAQAPVTTTSKVDRVLLSSEERRLAKEQAAKQRLEEQKAEQKALQEQLKSEREQSKAAEESADMWSKCLMIAMRIISGNIVPRQDHRYLAKNNPELYSQAISLRMERENPKKYKRLSEKEKPEEISLTQRLDPEESEDEIEATTPEDTTSQEGTPPPTLDLRV